MWIISNSAQPGPNDLLKPGDIVLKESAEHPDVKMKTDHLVPNWGESPKEDSQGNICGWQKWDYETAKGDFHPSLFLWASWVNTWSMRMTH